MKIRSIMAMIPLIALIAWLASTAHRVLQDRDRQIWHLVIDRGSGAIGLAGHGVPFDFPSRFVAELIGRDWVEDFSCPCGIGSNPGVIEAGRGSRNELLLKQSNEWSKPYQRSMELKIDLALYERTIRHDQAVIDRMDRDLAWAAWNGSWIHGHAGVRRSYQRGIDQRLARIPTTRALLAKYRAAALHPWDPIEPDSPSLNQ